MTFPSAIESGQMRPTQRQGLMRYYGVCCSPTFRVDCEFSQLRSRAPFALARSLRPGAFVIRALRKTISKTAHGGILVSKKCLSVVADQFPVNREPITPTSLRARLN